jgi:CRP/FNR family transcriptional regulator, anaerobic regulatory protein
MNKTIICKLPFESILLQASHSPPKQLQLLKTFNHAPRLQFNYLYSAAISALQRVAVFFIHLSEYIQQACLSYPFILPMRQQEIANFLGIAPETLSRFISVLQKENAVNIKNNKVIFMNIEKLKRV